MGERIALALKVDAEFEECLEFSWGMLDESEQDSLVDSTIEMVIDRSDRTSAVKGPLQPAKDATVKRVAMGTSRKGSVQNMPDGRNFLISIAGKLRHGGKVRSPWVRASTMNTKERDLDLGNLDPMCMPRLGCKTCPCLGYIPQRFSLNSGDKMRCRRCGCMYTDHVLVEASEILRTREERAQKKLRGKVLKPLPIEALDWDDRECMLWFCSDGLFHPRETVGIERPPLPEAAQKRPGGVDGIAGKKGRVSCIVPTTESRQKFHRTLWQCFEAQAWADKELVVVETYAKNSSEFLEEVAKKDRRLIYVKFKREANADWSIGLKRNMCAHLATGELVANFDDDDIYAPSYLTTMVPQLAAKNAHAITLSSWFIFDTRTCKWSFCDAIAWGWQKGLDGEAQDVKNWAYGYGFSYVHRRRDLMEVPYEDINMGEDFSFVSRLLLKNGSSAVALFHDEFGICLHTQHGENTSNSFPIRQVTNEEAFDLDIADLPHKVIADIFSRAGEDAPVPTRGSRTLVAHLLQGDFTVVCMPGVTVMEFLILLEQSLREPCSDMKVFCAPPEALKVRVEERQGSTEWMAEILGFELEEPFVGEVSKEAADKVRAQKEDMIEKARCSMHKRDRIGLRVKHLWVVPASMVPADEESDWEEDAPYETIEVTIQKSDVKTFFSVSSTIQARVPQGSDVSYLRSLFGDDMPRKARVLAERQGRGLMPLTDTDKVPDKITVTEFKGTRSFYMRFSNDMCRSSLLMMKRYWEKKEAQRELDEIVKSSGENEMEFRGKLSVLLMNGAYPPIFRRYNIPEGSVGTRVLQEGLGAIMTDRELVKLWLEVETLSRNKHNIVSATVALKALADM